MLFDMLDVPVFGREEDAADETASFIALQFNGTSHARSLKALCTSGRGKGSRCLGTDERVVG